MPVRVTLLMLSGLRDPTWELDAEQSEEWSRRVQAALEQLSPTTPPMRDALGYRGMRVESDGNEMYVSYGTLIVPRRWSTSGKNVVELERWLLRTGEGRVDAAFIAAAEAQLDEERPASG